MSDRITGYNLPHLGEFTQRELNLLREELPKGLTYRLYGGEESKYYTITQKMIDFLRDVEGKVLLVGDQVLIDSTLESYDIPVVGKEYLNEPYIFPTPNIWRDFWGWVKFTFDRVGYYRDLAKQHLEAIKPIMADEYVSLPLKVMQNGAYQSYAKVFLDTADFFHIDLHVFGDDPDKFADNLTWYKVHSKGRPIHFGEFSGTTNERMQATLLKNTEEHRIRHHELMDIAQNVLGDQLGEVLYFTLAANETTQGWKNPSYLHRYYVGDSVENTIPNVWP